MRTILAIVSLALLMAGCTSAQCDKVQPYQKARPRVPLSVPGDLSEPPLRSRAPEVEVNEAPRRADGRCLDQPPEYIPPADEDEQGIS